MNKYKIPKETTEHIAGMKVVDPQGNMGGGGNEDSLTGMVHVTPADGELYVQTEVESKALWVLTDKNVYAVLIIDGEQSLIIDDAAPEIYEYISDNALKTCLAKGTCNAIIGSASAEYDQINIISAKLENVLPSDAIPVAAPDAFDLWLPAIDIDRLLAEV